MKFHYPNIDRIEDISAPLLFVHSSMDIKINATHSRELFLKATHSAGLENEGSGHQYGHNVKNVTFASSARWHGGGAVRVPSGEACAGRSGAPRGLRTQVVAGPGARLHPQGRAVCSRQRGNVLSRTLSNAAVGRVLVLYGTRALLYACGIAKAKLAVRITLPRLLHKPFVSYYYYRRAVSVAALSAIAVFFLFIFAARST
jgi:hypothetical protein